MLIFIPLRHNKQCCHCPAQTGSEECFCPHNLIYSWYNPILRKRGVLHSLPLLLQTQAELETENRQAIFFSFLKSFTFQVE